MIFIFPFTRQRITTDTVITAIVQVTTITTAAMVESKIILAAWEAEELLSDDWLLSVDDDWLLSADDWLLSSLTEKVVSK